MNIGMTRKPSMDNGGTPSYLSTDLVHVVFKTLWVAFFLLYFSRLANFKEQKNDSRKTNLIYTCLCWSVLPIQITIFCLKVDAVMLEALFCNWYLNLVQNKQNKYRFSGNNCRRYEWFSFLFISFLCEE